MNIVLNILLIILSLVMQISLLPKLEIYGAFPNLMMLIMLSLMFNKQKEAIWWAGFGGILMDIYSPFYFGYYTTVFLLVYFIFHYLLKQYITDVSLALSAVFFFISSVIIDLVPAIYTSKYELILYNAIYSTFIGVIVYALIKRFSKPADEYKINI